MLEARLNSGLDITSLGGLGDTGRHAVAGLIADGLVDPAAAFQRQPRPDAQGPAARRRRGPQDPAGLTDLPTQRNGTAGPAATEPAVQAGRPLVRTGWAGLHAECGRYLIQRRLKS